MNAAVPIVAIISMLHCIVFQAEMNVAVPIVAIISMLHYIVFQEGERTHGNFHQ